MRKGLNRLSDKGRLDANKVHSIYMLMSYFLWTISTLMTLDYIGIRLSFLLASSAALLVGIGLGLQQIFTDIVSGLFILFEGSIRVHDILEVDGMVGQIEEINIRNSKLRTRDGIAVIIPNHKFVHENVINWSHSANETRFRIIISVAYDSDVAHVKQVLEEVAASHPLIDTAENLKPIARIANFGDNGIDFHILLWSANVFYIENTLAEIRMSIIQRFNRENIVVPFPQRDLHLISTPAKKKKKEKNKDKEL
jgi:small-conductance mechanosensitive channel